MGIQVISSLTHSFIGKIGVSTAELNCGLGALRVLFSDSFIHFCRLTSSSKRCPITRNNLSGSDIFCCAIQIIIMIHFHFRNRNSLAYLSLRLPTKGSPTARLTLQALIPATSQQSPLVRLHSRLLVQKYNISHETLRRGCFRPRRIPSYPSARFATPSNDPKRSSRPNSQISYY